MSRTHHSFAISSPAFAVMAFCSASLWAADKGPQVHFGASYTVQCSDVTPKSTDKNVPAKSKLIQATFRLSADIRGREADLDELSYCIKSVDKSLRVRKTLPTTTLIPRVKGYIIVEKRMASTTSDSSEKQERKGLRLNVRNVGTAGLETEEKSRKSEENQQFTQEKYSRESPKDPKLIVSLVGREEGVRYKLKPTDQDTIEGIKEFLVEFEVSSDWQGGWVKVVCEARDAHGTDGRTFAVGLFLEGDEYAEQAAKALADVDMEIGKYEDYRDIPESTWDNFKKKRDALRDFSRGRHIKER